ncbi:MAG: hypothetical protein DRJ43_04145 [Thermoprotei archaeon]|nr:MAG: hypothetical protein DRJ43_04145 [Thermoprotei archaeon]
MSGSGKESFDADELGTYYIYLQDENCSETKKLRVKAPPKPPCKAYGDLDDDGYVSKKDVELLVKYIYGFVTLTEEQKRRADVNADGTIDWEDAKLLEQFVLGEIDTFPVCELIVLTSDSPFFVQVEDPDGVLTEEDEWWYSNRSRGDASPRIIMRVRGSSLKFTIKQGRGWNALTVEGSSDLESWEMLYEEEPIEGGGEWVEEKEVVVDIENYDFVRFTLTDGDQTNEWLRLSKRMFVRDKQPLPLCEWLPSSITSMDIAELVLAFNGIKDLGFVVLRKDIEGVAKLYKGEEFDCGW